MERVDRQRVTINAWDHNRVLKNALVGCYQLNLQRVYMEPNHCLEHIWLALSDPNHNFGAIVGYVKISISVLHEDDPGVTLRHEPYQSLTVEKKVLMPPHIERKSYQLTVDIFEARKLKPVDGDTCDAYIGVEFGQIYEKTETQPKTTEPVWNERILVPVHLPAIIDNIIMRVIDANIIQKKEIIGSFYLNINRLINETEVAQERGQANRLSNITTTQWVNVYGSQLGCEDSEVKHNYSIYPDTAPWYVGSLLIQATMERNSNPKKERTPLLIKAPRPPLVYYNVEVDIEMGLGLSMDYHQYRIGIRIGEHYQ